MINSLLKALLAMLAFAIPQAAAACVSAIVTETGAVPYDATTPVDTLRTIQVRLEGTCGQTSAFPVRITFNDDVELAPFQQVGGVPFAILRAGRNLLQSPATAVVMPFDVLVNPAGEVLEFQLQLASGYVAVDAIRPIDLTISYDDGQGFIDEARFPISVAIMALPSFSLELEGGLSERRIDFGVLEAGEIQEVLLGITATGPYEIGMSTEYGEMMRRADPCGVPMLPPVDAADLVRYSVTLDNAAIAANRVARSAGPAIGSMLAQRNVPVRIAIDSALDPESVRAGTYCDVITLSIASQP